jgi:hypothetical protein
MTEISASTESANGFQLLIARIVWAIVVIVSSTLFALTVQNYVRSVFDLNLAPAGSPLYLDAQLTVAGGLVATAVYVILGLIIAFNLNDSVYALFVSGVFIAFGFSQNLPITFDVPDAATRMLGFMALVVSAVRIPVFLLFPRGRLSNHPMLFAASLLVIVLGAVLVVGLPFLNQYRAWIGLGVWLLVFVIIWYHYRQVQPVLDKSQYRVELIGIAGIIIGILIGIVRGPIFTALSNSIAGDFFMANRMVSLIGIAVGLLAPLTITYALVFLPRQRGEN